MKKLTVVIVFCLAAFIFLFRLPDNPPGFHIDESIIGFEAYHLLKTGGYSSIGEFLPRYIATDADMQRSFPGAFILFVIPFVGLFGLQEWAVRFVAVCASLVCMGILFFILKRKVGLTVAICTIVWWPLTSWIWLFSRVGLEHTFYAVLYILLIWILYQFAGRVINWRNSIFFGVLQLLLFYSYTAGRLFAVCLNGAVIGILLIRKAPLKYLIFLVAACFLTIFLSWEYIADGSFFYRTNELVQFCSGSEALCFINNLLSHINPLSYFQKTYIPLDFPVLTHSVVGTSLLPRFLAPFLFIGFVSVIYKALKKDTFSLILLTTMAIAILPASFTIRGFDSRRSFALAPLLFICIGFGIAFVLNRIQKRGRNAVIAAVMVFFLSTAGFGAYELYRFSRYEYYPQVAVLHGWQYGFPQAMDFIEQEIPHGTAIIVTPKVSYKAKNYLRFFNSDNKYQMRIGELACTQNSSKKAYYVIRPEEIANNSRLLQHVKDIFYPNNRDIALQIVRLRDY